MPVDTLTPDQVTTKQRQRQGVMLNIKKELNKARTLLDTRPVNPTSIKASLGKLCGYNKRLHDFNNEIQLALVGDDQERDIGQMTELDDDISDMISQLEATDEVMKEESFLSRNSTVADTSQHNITSSSVGESSRIKLPKIDLPTYSGDPLKWDEFWDYYDVTFHSNNDIPVIEKFTYLRDILTDEAQRAIAGYRLTAANYEEVIKALKQRFGDPEVAIFHHFDAMLSMSVSSGEVKELQRVFDTCETHIRSLIALGLSEDTFGRVFAPILLSKLPGNIRIELIRKKGRGAWSLNMLREYLRDEIYARDMSKRSFGTQPSYKSSQSSAQDQQSGNQNRRWKKGQYTASTLSSAEGSASSSRRPVFCAFCNGSHYSNECPQFTTASSRREQMKGSCCACLGHGHLVRDCPKPFRPCYNCRETGHHQSLCEKRYPSGKGKTSGTSTQMKVDVSNIDIAGDINSRTSVVDKSVTSSVMSHGGQRGVLQTAIADVSGQTGMTTARQMLDNGSDNSFISCKLAQQIGARCIGSETISLAGFSDSKRRQKTCKIFEFDLRLRDGNFLTIKAYGTDVIICSIDKLAFDLKKYPILARVPLAEPLAEKHNHVDVDILIGSDYYYEIVGTERIPLMDGLLLLDSQLGYVIAGRANSTSTNAASMLFTHSPMLQNNFDLERFWRLEEIGVKETIDLKEDEIALASFNKTIRFDHAEKRYMVKWPFKPESPSLPDNFSLAFRRLKSLVSRATSENGLIEKCQTIFDDQIKKGIIEEAPVVPSSDKVHYLPHHAVITPQKTTTKVRIVYDASSKINKNVPSLNDCLHRGPVLLENLCGLLMRFRVYSIGVISDIEKAFLQVGLQEEDRDVTRFLWLRDLSKPCTPDNIIVYRFCRVCFGINSSPFLLGGTVVFHLNNVDTPVARQIKQNLYVDNVFDGHHSTSSALTYYNEAKQIFNDASMNLREWQSNDTSFMNSFPEVDRGSHEKAKVLGLLWDLKLDTFSCPTDGLKGSDVVTKRFVLRTIAKVYDPCGFFTPVTSPAKWLIQELWQQKYDWDTPLSGEFVQRWQIIFESLLGLSTCNIPRCYNLKVDLEHSLIDIHVFCDASAKAYCAVVYMSVTSVDGQCSSHLVFSKSRVSPLKQQSIPRLELMAATVGVRLLEFVSKELRLPIRSKYLWSDSQCVLHWIVGKPVSTIFVRNRVNEIKNVSKVEFRYVPTAQNPADIPTRGMDSNELNSCKLWWQGPAWIVDPLNWPKDAVPMHSIEKLIEDSESVVEIDERVTMAATTQVVTEYLVDLMRVSTLKRLFRITGWILRFVRNCRIKTRTCSKMVLRQRNNDSDQLKREYFPILQAQEIYSAKLYWDRIVQRRHFYERINENKFTTFTKTLGSSFIDTDGIIRCHGRLANTDLDGATISPKLLPSGDLYTRLVIADCHEAFGHAGVAQTLAELRCEYWVIKGRSEVKQVRNKCLICRRLRGGSYQIPLAPDLPDFRVTKRPPFSVVGLDYLGPLLTFNSGAQQQKVWICLFTCAVTRAVHLEIVNSMSSDQFLLCFRRFVAFNGCPELVISDNAGQFEASRRVLHKLWYECCCSKMIQEYSSTKNIEWKFIPESAPWMGGFYERLVGVVKSSLKATINRRKLSFVELQTIVYEVSTIVNSRPLSYVEDEVGDLPLTPAHLTMRHRTIAPFESVGEPSDNPISSQAKLMSGWKRLTKLLDSFWEICCRSCCTDDSMYR